MRSARMVAVPAVVVALASLAASGTEAAGYTRPGSTQVVSAAPNGSALGGDPLAGSSVSGNGRYVAFITRARLSTQDRNPFSDVYVHDRTTRRMSLVSVSSTGTSGTGGSVAPFMSASGRYVVFASDDPALVPADVNGRRDVFIHDRKTRSTELVSVGIAGTPAISAGGSFDGSVSDDGRYVAFATDAANIIGNDTNAWPDVFVRDRKSDTTTRVSVSSEGAQADGTNFDPSISGNGRYVAFTSAATNLVPDDRNAVLDIFVHDLRTKKTEIVSVTSIGTQHAASVSARLGGSPTISKTGRFVVFLSSGGEFVPNDGNLFKPFRFAEDVFVKDRKTGRVERVDVTSAGRETENASLFAGISADGRFVVFHSFANYLDPRDTDPEDPLCCDNDIFLHDRATGITEMMSISSSGAEAEVCAFDGANTGPAYAPSIGATGRYVTFASCSGNLAPRDTNDDWDIFVHDRGPALGTRGVGIATGSDDVGDATGVADAGAELIGATIARRPALDDLYVKISIDRIPGPRGTGLAGNPALVYGMRFRVAGIDYEMRAAKMHPGASFGLFRCSGGSCAEVARVEGGYGTIGDSVVAAIPDELVGLDEGDRPTDLLAFSALGTYPADNLQILDVVRLAVP